MELSTGYGPQWLCLRYLKTLESMHSGQLSPVAGQIHAVPSGCGHLAGEGLPRKLRNPAPPPPILHTVAELLAPVTCATYPGTNCTLQLFSVAQSLDVLPPQPEGRTSLEPGKCQPACSRPVGVLSWQNGHIPAFKATKNVLFQLMCHPHSAVRLQIFGSFECGETQLHCAYCV